MFSLLDSFLFEVEVAEAAVSFLGFLSHEYGVQFYLFLYISLLIFFLGPLLKICCSGIGTIIVELVFFLFSFLILVNEKLIRQE